MRLHREGRRSWRTFSRTSVAVIASEAKQPHFACAVMAEIASACCARLAMTLSNRDVRLALAHLGGVERPFGESFLLRKDERRRTHALRFLLEPRRMAALLDRLRRLAQ